MSPRSESYHHPWRRDLMVIAACCVLVFLLASFTDPIDALMDWAEEHEDWEIDELLSVIMFLNGAFMIFALRRWRELMLEVRLREQIQDRLTLQAHLATLAADIGSTLAGSTRLEEMMQQCADILAGSPRIVAARLWLTGPREEGLELVTGAGPGPATRSPAVEPPLRLPLLVGDRPIGQLEITLAARPDESTLQTLNTVARSLGVGIERKRTETQLQHDAFHDALTGLPNRMLFMDRLALALERARRQSTLLTVLFVDLDRFKVINDSLGHLAGDKLLIETAKRLKACVRAQDTVARLGGDEFTVILEDLHGIEAAVEVAERIQAAVSQPLFFEDNEVFTSASIGIAEGIPGSTALEVLRDADTAMYRAKAQGKARHVVFDAAMRDSALSRFQIEVDLRRSLDRREFQVHYQPIIALRSGRVEGIEALARWHHPERGSIPPSEFIPTAEETGLIHPLGMQVLEQACRQFVALQQELGQAAPQLLSVNISARQLVVPTFLQDIRQTLEQTGIDPHHLALELTESTLADSSAPTLRILNALRALGIHLHIDDFGTGYSSLSYLNRLPVEGLKIDRSFIERICTDARELSIVRSILELARGMKVEVIAEGVENESQLEMLRTLACGYGQGFLIARPVEFKRLSCLIAEHYWRSQSGDALAVEPSASSPLAHPAL